MKSKLLFLILIFFVAFSCKESLKKQEINLSTKTLPELIRVGYDLRNSDEFSKVCQLLNDSILSLNDYFEIAPTTFIVYEVIEQNDTIIREVDWGFRIEKREPAPISNRLIFDICIQNDSIFINDKLSELSNIQKLAEHYIFHSDSEYTKEKRFVKYFGEIEVTKVFAILNTNIKNNNGLSVDEWSILYECMHELVLVFDKKQNELASEKWNVPFKSLSNKQKLAIYDIVDYRIWLYFDSNCPFI